MISPRLNHSVDSGKTGGSLKSLNKRNVYGAEETRIGVVGDENELSIIPHAKLFPKSENGVP